MRWLKRLMERWKRFIEEAAKANERMWKGQRPSCCAKETKKEK